MQGFSVRVARGLNGLTGRKGPVFTERYHLVTLLEAAPLRILETPTETRNARAYVINNFRRHAAEAGRRVDAGWVDPCSSWAWFDGWRNLSRTQVDLARQLWCCRRRRLLRAGPAAVAEPKSWLMRVGWRRRGLVRVNEVPAQCKR